MHAYGLHKISISNEESNANVNRRVTYTVMIENSSCYYSRENQMRHNNLLFEVSLHKLRYEEIY